MDAEQQAYAALGQKEYARAEALFDTLPGDGRRFGLGSVPALTERLDETRSHAPQTVSARPSHRRAAPIFRMRLDRRK